MDTFEAIFTRVSVRRFKPDPIPDNVARKILEAGIRAPSAGNEQHWYFIVVKDDEELKAKLHELILKAHIKYAEEVMREGAMPEDVKRRWLEALRKGEMYKAPLYVAAYLDLRRSQYRKEYAELERIWAIQSLSAAIENMILAAWAEGIGSVWLGDPLLMPEEFNALLKPPEGCELQAVIAFGYPARIPKPRPRKPLEEVSKWL